MRSKFSIAGHPIHPMLVVVPIGLIIWTLVADIIYVATDDRAWYDIAYWSGIAAIVSALIAAVPGFVDFVSVARHTTARGIAIAHMVINLAVVAAFVVAIFIMMDEGALAGGALAAVVVLHAAGAALLLVSGWLGAELVYRHHLALIPEDIEVERAERARHGRGEESVAER
jgi:uncharacterized membrane protein